MARLGRTLRLSIERILPGGDGLGRADGLAVFVPLAAPGDELTVRAVEEKPGFLRAEIVDILSPGPGRVAPACPLYGSCGGCNLQHLGYESQLEAKLGIAADAWRRAGGVEGVEFDVVPSPALGYRNRAQFHVGGQGQLGYARRGSNQVLGVTACPILAPPLAGWLTDRARPGDETAETLRKAGKAGRDRFVAFGQGDRVFIEGLDAEATAELGGKSFRFSVGGFFQSNLALVERLVPSVCSGAAGARAADLYCGVGLFAAFLKDGCLSLCCVEQDTRALGLACANVGRGPTYAATGVEAWTRSPQARGPFDVVVVDPPRAGLSARVRAWLAEARPASIRYVSCDPVSLARDAGFLVKAGYSVESATILDFYPQTSHVESHARFALR
jgi:23S rRNA (uracil1939-C5)-methyltransferase